MHFCSNTADFNQSEINERALHEILREKLARVNQTSWGVQSVVGACLFGGVIGVRPSSVEPRARESE